MIKNVWSAVVFVGALVIVTVAWVPLFWLRRREDAPRGVMVVDPDIDFDDPGVDVDGDA